MEHPTVLKPAEQGEWRPDKMRKATIYESPRLLVGLNAFEHGQSHTLHAHKGMDKMYPEIPLCSQSPGSMSRPSIR